MESDMIMFMAYLFINTEIGSESSVLKALKKVEGVEEAHGIIGIYDIVARIKTDTRDKLKSIIAKNIGGNKKITAKLTVLIREA
jgi:DNA-binding Lrp family transcriptional regulator